jgi:thiaminase (transcriptional activator TenA)
MNFYKDHLETMLKKTASVMEQSKHMQDILYGRVPQVRFVFQIKQNYQYLMDYLRTWSTALAKCEDFEQMSDLLVIVNDIYKGIEYNREYWAPKIGLSTEEMDATIEAEGKRSYTAFQSMIAHTGTLAELVCAVFPCGIMYKYFGEDLLPQCKLPEDNLYYQWIAYYATDHYKQEAANKEAMINKYCANKTEREIAKLLEITATACNYEILQFDNLYYKMQTWPLEEIFPKKFTTYKD